MTTTQTTNHPFYGHYAGIPALASTSSSELEDFFGAKFYCPHALAEGNQRIWIREKMMELLFNRVIYTVYVSPLMTATLTRNTDNLLHDLDDMKIKCYTKNFFTVCDYQVQLLE